MMNSKVIVIPAKKKKGNSIKESEKKKLRVAAYARVSTDSDEQATSYDTQIDHYTNYIKKNPDWEFAGVFSDEGISGTYTKKRAGFNKMIEEAMEGNIDYIITKSISRFARNTLDCLKYIRKLKENNIPVYIEKESGKKFKDLLGPPEEGTMLGGRRFKARQPSEHFFYGQVN